MTEAVVAGALAVATLNAIPALLGGLIYYRREPTDRRALRGFWMLLRIGQASGLVFALAIGVLAAAGHYSSEHLFYLYALLPLVVAFVAEQLRVSSAQTILDQRGLQGAQAVAAMSEGEQQALVDDIVRREMIVMALSALVVVVLELRAAGTAHGF